MNALLLVHWTWIVIIQASGVSDIDISEQPARTFFEEQQEVISDLKVRISELSIMGIIPH